MNGDTEHDTLADTLLDCCALTRVGADLWHPRDEVIDAILDKFLPDHDKRVREQTLRDFLSYRMLPSDVREYVSEYLAAGREASDD